MEINLYGKYVIDMVDVCNISKYIATLNECRDKYIAAISKDKTTTPIDINEANEMFDDIEYVLNCLEDAEELDNYIDDDDY